MAVMLQPIQEEAVAAQVQRAAVVERAEVTAAVV